MDVIVTVIQGSRPASCPYAGGVSQAEWQSATPRIDSTRNKTDCSDCEFFLQAGPGDGADWHARCSMVWHERKAKLLDTVIIGGLKYFTVMTYSQNVEALRGCVWGTVGKLVL